MIFFGDPESSGVKEDALACARMAIAMRSRVAMLQEDWQRQAGPVQLHVRMGINTGYCTVGNFGSEDRLDYTIVGKEVAAKACGMGANSLWTCPRRSASSATAISC